MLYMLALDLLQKSYKIKIKVTEVISRTTETNTRLLVFIIMHFAIEFSPPFSFFLSRKTLAVVGTHIVFLIAKRQM